MITLSERGIRLYRCQLETHDYLWFASYDVAGISSTEAVVHNYALSYALNRFERSIVYQRVPTYEEDLAEMSIYPLPAHSVGAGKTVLTFNAVNSKTQQTQDPTYKAKNTPMLGKRSCVDLGTRFSFYAFARQGARLPRVIRLGKKRVPCRLTIEEIKVPRAIFSSERFRPTHLVNPLDVSGRVITYSVVSIAPFLLLRDLTLEGDWLVKAGVDIVHVPRRVLQWAEVVECA
jgi:CRISPR-associated protein Csc1